MRSINVDKIEDKATHDALLAIRSILYEDLPILRGDWKYFSYEIASAGTISIEHDLGYAPSDFLVTFDSANTTINYELVTDEVISVTTGSGGFLRGFYGKYADEAIV